MVLFPPLIKHRTFLRYRSNFCPSAMPGTPQECGSRGRWVPAVHPSDGQTPLRALPHHPHGHTDRPCPGGLRHPQPSPAGAAWGKQPRGWSGLSLGWLVGLAFVLNINFLSCLQAQQVKLLRSSPPLRFQAPSRVRPQHASCTHAGPLRPGQLPG